MLVSITFGEFFPLEQLTRSWKASRTRQPRIFPRDGSLLGQALQMLGMARSWDRPFKMLGTGPLLGQGLWVKIVLLGGMGMEWELIIL